MAFRGSLIDHPRASVTLEGEGEGGDGYEAHDSIEAE